MYKILFTNVKAVKIQEKQSAVITTREGDKFIFVPSDANNTELFGYCELLYALPNCVIPEKPTTCLVTQKDIELYNDPCRNNASKCLKHLV